MQAASAPVSLDTYGKPRSRGACSDSSGLADPHVCPALPGVAPHRAAHDLRRHRLSPPGFHSIGVDLIYGLPHQTVDSFSRTLDTMLALAPDRLSVFGYAHMPQLFKMQRQTDASALPSPAVRMAILRLVVERLTSAGYVYIGMDHFALPTDQLARAQEQRTLHRNFQGYSTRAECDLICFGASSIGQVGDVYAQNAKELERLRSFAEDGLVSIGGGKLEVLMAGRVLLRNIAMGFDWYFGQQTMERFSRAV
jgi:oxygen-independent coproporphyrinogen-3 oxidase